MGMFSQWGMLLAPSRLPLFSLYLRPRTLPHSSLCHDRYTNAVQGYALDAQSPAYTLPLAQAANEGPQLIAIKYGTSQSAVRPPCLEASTCTPKPGNCLIGNVCYANGYAAADEGVPCQLCDSSKSNTAWSDGPTIGTTECLIDGACTAANQYACALATAPPRCRHRSSRCASAEPARPPRSHCPRHHTDARRRAAPRRLRLTRRLPHTSLAASAGACH